MWVADLAGGWGAPGIDFEYGGAYARQHGEVRASGLQLSGGRREQILQRLLREYRQTAIYRL